MHQKIIIADDHSIIRNGLRLYLQYNIGCNDITEVGTCSSLMLALSKQDFTHLILDIVLSDGNSLEILPNLKKLYPNLQIMVFSMQPAEVYAQAMQQYGIQQYLSKQVGEDEILNNLQLFLNNSINTSQVYYKDSPFSSLAPRELEVLHYLLKGEGTKTISECLNLKMNTISTIKKRVFEKTAASNIKELLELATLYNVNF